MIQAFWNLLGIFGFFLFLRRDIFNLKYQTIFFLIVFFHLHLCEVRSCGLLSFSFSLRLTFVGNYESPECTNRQILSSCKRCAIHCYCFGNQMNFETWRFFRNQRESILGISADHLARGQALIKRPSDFIQVARSRLLEIVSSSPVSIHQLLYIYNSAFWIVSFRCRRDMKLRHGIEKRTKED